MQHREERVAAAIKHAVAEIILNELSDPAIGFVTVTRCRVTRDLKNAVVFLSIMGDKTRQETSLSHLRHATGFIRRRLGTRVKLRYLPELRLALDDILAQEQRVGDILHELFPDVPPAASAASEGADSGQPK
ncbi:MAG: 30S ribosome-binding factor RbfA [candidate division WOR-3 bacterium]